MSTPHDSIFKKVFEEPGAVKELLINCGARRLVEALDLDSLKLEKDTFIDERLKGLYSDLVYSCRWKNKEEKAFIGLVLEHKSFAPNIPHVQLLSYQAASYNYQLKLDKYRKELTPIIPVLIYHGEETWKYRDFSEHFQLPDAFFKRYVPSFDYVLIDLNDWSDAKIDAFKQGFVAATLRLMKHKRDTKYLLQQVREIFKFVKTITERDEALMSTRMAIIMYAFQAYPLTKAQVEMLIERMPKEIQGEARSGYETIMNEGRKEGRIEGKIEGKIEGRIEGKLFTATATVLRTLAQFPDMSIDQISAISDLKPKTVELLKTKVAYGNKASAEHTLRDLFSEMGPLEEQDLQHLLKLAGFQM